MDNRRHGQYWAHKTQNEDKQSRKHTHQKTGVGGLTWGVSGGRSS